MGSMVGSAGHSATTVPCSSCAAKSEADCSDHSGEAPGTAKPHAGAARDPDGARATSPATHAATTLAAMALVRRALDVATGRSNVGAALAAPVTARGGSAGDRAAFGGTAAAAGASGGRTCRGRRPVIQPAA